MTSTTETKPWDLSHVLGLINTLSLDSPPRQAERTGRQINPPDQPRDFGQTDSEEASIYKRDFATESTGLGDFSKIYQFLGTPVHTTSSPSQDQNGELPRLPIYEQYASDGATYIKPGSSSRNAAADWQDPFSTAEETVTDTVSEGTIGSEGPTLSKAQRKKLRKEQRQEEKKKRKQARKSLATRLAGNSIASESEADYGSPRTPARKASVHTVAAGTGKKASKEKDRVSTPSKDSTSGARKQGPPPPKTPQPSGAPSKRFNGAVAQPHSEPDSLGKPNVARPKSPLKNVTTPAAPSVTQASAQSSWKHTNGVRPKLPSKQNRTLTALPNSVEKSTSAEPPAPKTPQPLATPQDLRLLPSSVPPKPSGKPESTQHAFHNQIPHHFLHTKPPRAIEPTIVRTGEDRNWTLFMKLIREFWDDRKYLIAPMNLTTHNNDPKGIHVFVDASNIFIGFNEQLKRSRGIPPGTHVPPVGLSFDALALLMERRRPVAKRILVGSTPYLPAFDKAKAVGYECSILEKVYKARELTERQVYFKELEERQRMMSSSSQHGQQRTKVSAPPANNVVLASNSNSNGVTSGSGYVSGSGSASETNAPQFATPRMIEQGVDEILHLKILESVVDADEPGTIVLATGDAAQAEYSQGFMAMAQRALKKGWTVELVSWSANVSAMYRRKQWADAWGSRFRIVFLDDYAEELLDM